MKNLYLTVVIFFAVSTVLAAKPKSSLDDGNIVEAYALHILKDKIDTYDKRDIGRFLLKVEEPKTYQKIRDNQFELEEQSEEMLKKYKEKLANLPKIDKNKEYHLYLESGIKDYDFDNKHFFVDRIMDGTWFMTYHGTKIVSPRKNVTVLYFRNATKEASSIRMDKNKAKSFVKSRTKNNTQLRLNNTISIHYVFTIDDYFTKRGFEFDPSIHTSMRIQLDANLKYVEFIDPKTGDILDRYEYQSKVKPMPKETLVINSWFTPSKNVCTENGGVIKNGRCMGKWNIADKICKSEEGRLASTDEMIEKIIACGGKKERVNAPGLTASSFSISSSEVSEDNEKNKEYLVCLKELGISTYGDYWGTAEVTQDNFSGEYTESGLYMHLNFIGAKVRYSSNRGDQMDFNGKSVICVK